MAQAAALFLLLFGLLPIANWIPGGHDAPQYHEWLTGWLSGGGILAGVLVVLVIVLRSMPEWWLPGAWGRIAARWRRSRWVADAALGGAVAITCAAVSRLVLSARPLLIDEIIQLYQARIFASGRLWLPLPAHPEFTSAMHLLDWQGKVFGQFPAGGPAMLMLGVLVGAAWLVGPVCTGVGVWFFARLVRRIEPHDGAALAAVLLFAFSPFVVFLGGSMMDHVSETMWLLGAALALAHAVGDDDAHPFAALLTGTCLGIAATIRPLDALVFALPTACWLAARVVRPAGHGSRDVGHAGPTRPERRRHFVALIASGIGVAVPVAAMLAVNAAQTGHPLLFGYIAMWGKTHALGFHASPWGPPHTPARGVELVNLYLLRLQVYFLETPAPSLLFATGALALTRRLEPWDRWMLAVGGGLLLAYFAYWHDGFYLGPRFMLPLAPWLALWTARFPSRLADRGASVPLQRAMVATGMLALVMALTGWVPIRARQYRNGMLSMRLDAPGAARAAGVHDAVVLVRESWGAQLVARLWALGVTRPETEHIYRSTDACALDSVITSVERDHGDSTEVERRLGPLVADSARLITIHDLPDTTVRFLPGSTLRPECVRRLIEDRAGFTVYPPFLLARGDSNRYLRDLHADDSVLVDANPGRPLWLLTEDPEIGGGLRFHRVSPDSMEQEWRAP